MVKFSAEIEIKNGKIYITPSYDDSKDYTELDKICNSIEAYKNIYVLPF